MLLEAIFFPLLEDSTYGFSNNGKKAMRREDDDSPEPVDEKPRRRRLPPRQRPPRLLQHDGQADAGLPLRGKSLAPTHPYFLKNNYKSH